MATGAKLGYGGVLKRGLGNSPQTFNTIAEVRKVGGIGGSRELKDVTNLDSAGNAMEYILAMKDGIEFPVEVNFLPLNATQSNSAGLIADFNNGTTRDFRMTLGSSFGEFQFSALVREWKAEIDPKEPMVATFTLKISGPVTYS